MLAVLACILDNPRTLSKSSEGNKLEINSCQLFQDHGDPVYDYYPSEEVAKSHFGSQLTTESSIPVDSQKAMSGPHSAQSSIGPVSDMSTSETPPSHYKPSRISPEHKNSQSTSLSISPEHFRHAHRSNSNLNSLAASFSRPFSFSSAASSPPNPNPKKRSSPVGTYLGNTAPTVTWSTSGLFGRSSTDTEDPKSSSLSLSDAEKEVVRTPKKPVFRTKLKNQDQFLNDGYANVPLLDPSREWQYRAYREAYAHLLYIWDMPIARADLLNHNRPLQPDTTTPVTFPRKSTTPFGALAGANLLNSGYTKENSNPVFRDHCPYCSTLLLPSRTPARRCQSCSKLPPAPLCLLCNTFIRGLSSPCPNCGHILHASCRELLSQASLDECPSACGCVCADYTCMPLPSLLAADSVSSAAAHDVRRRRPGHDDGDGGDDDDDDDDASLAGGSPTVTVTGGGGDEGTNEQEQLGWNEVGWEDMAYESLVRNLRSSGEARGKTRKTSK